MGLGLGNRRPNAGPRRLRSAVLVAAACAAALFWAAGPASAGQVAASSCPSDALCLWDGPNFTGDIFSVTSFNPAGICVSLVDHGWGDRAVSATNTHENSAAMFMNDDCVGGPYQVAPNSSIPDFGTFRPDSVWVPAT